MEESSSGSSRSMTLHGLPCLLLAFLALVLGCTAPAARMRRMEELPDSYRATWQAWLDDDPSWPEQRALLREDPELEGFVADNLLRQLLVSYGEQRFTTLESTRIGPFERARAELLILREASLPRLVELFAVGNAEASELAADLLSRLGRDAVLPVAELLERDEVMARQRSAELLGRLDMLPPEEEARVRGALVEALAGDEDWLVRARAAESLAGRGVRDRSMREARTALIQALGDPDPAVNVRAARSLAHLDDPQAVPALILYLDRSTALDQPGGMLAAQEALRGLLDAGGRARTSGEWHELWKEWLRARRAGGS